MTKVLVVDDESSISGAIAYAIHSASGVPAKQSSAAHLPSAPVTSIARPVLHLGAGGFHFPQLEINSCPMI